MNGIKSEAAKVIATTLPSKINEIMLKYGLQFVVQDLGFDYSIVRPPIVKDGALTYSMKGFFFAAPNTEAYEAQEPAPSAFGHDLELSIGAVTLQSLVSIMAGQGVTFNVSLAYE